MYDYLKSNDSVCDHDVNGNISKISNIASLNESNRNSVLLRSGEVCPKDVGIKYFQKNMLKVRFAKKEPLIVKLGVSPEVKSKQKKNF